MNEIEKLLFDCSIRQRLPETPYPEPISESSGFTPAKLLEFGYAYWMQKGDEIFGITIMTFGKGRICSNLNNCGYDDFWCYESFYDAVQALIAWNPIDEQEVQGWFRHYSTGRRREGGDPSKEHIER
jgi:hypothetical protein